VNGGNVDFFGFRLGVTEQHPIDSRVYRSLSGSKVHVKLFLKAFPDLALGDRVQIRVTEEFLDSTFKLGVRWSIPDIHIFGCPCPGKVHAEIIRSTSLLLGMITAVLLTVARRVVSHLVPWSVATRMRT
jgi:hypothetical protein